MSSAYRNTTRPVSVRVNPRPLLANSGAFSAFSRSRIWPLMVGWDRCRLGQVLDVTRRGRFPDHIMSDRLLLLALADRIEFAASDIASVGGS